MLKQLNSIKLSLIQMAFVFRNQRKTQARRASIPGPGAYDFQVQTNNKLPRTFVPFGSMQHKLRAFSEHINNQTPGVGSYNIDLKSNGEKIIVSSQTEDIKILQISRPNPVFKSSTFRFKGENKQQSPGPGEYEISQALIRNKIYSVGPSNKSKVIEQLINLNKYQSIPSIPSNIHAYGYNDALQLNEPPVQVFKGQKGNSIGPGQYDAKTQVTKLKSISWSQPKTKRAQPSPVYNQNLGPGCYQIKTMQPLHSFKPSPGFASKTLRSMDQRKGFIPGKGLQKIKQSRISQNPSESRMLSEKAPPSTNVGDSDYSDEDSIQYIDDTTPGPGSYEVHANTLITNKKLYSHRQKPSFGVTTKRFRKKQKQTGNIGPGEYYQQIQPRIFKAKTIKEDKKEEGRFPGLVDVKVAKIVPGPGSYQPRNTMEDKLIYKIQRGYRGQFGSTQTRSKDEYNMAGQQPGPGSYDPHGIVDQKTSYAIFKSVTNRKGITQINQNPAPGSYSLINYDIATKVIKQEQEDPDLIIKKPGFGVGEKRFKQMPNKIDQQDFQDDDIIKQIQQKYHQQKKRKNLKPSAPFRNKEPRFDQKLTKKEIPGPGAYYDGEQDQWNKRTYNILFADI